MLLPLIVFSTFAISLSHGTGCHSLQQSQLASLNERMNQMISALYSTPFSKSKQPGSSYQSTTPAPPSEYSQAVAQYDPSYYGYQPTAASPTAPYMYSYTSQPVAAPVPTTVAISSPTPGSPPTVTISSTRMPCYSQYEGQEYAYPKPYPPQYYDYYSQQYALPASYRPAPTADCPCQCSSEYPAAPAPSCPHRPAYSPPAQPDYAPGSCPPAPSCPPPCPPQYDPAAYQHQQPPSYQSSPYPVPPAYPPPAYPPSPAYGPPAYPPPSPPSPYPPAPVYANPRDVMQPPQY